MTLCLTSCRCGTKWPWRLIVSAHRPPPLERAMHLDDLTPEVAPSSLLIVEVG